MVATKAKGNRGGCALFGAHADAPEAAAFAEIVADLMHRYARDIVAKNQLCPFLHNVEAGLGAVVVALDRVPDPDATARAIRATERDVVHVVFPLVDRENSPAFERFGNSVAEKLRKDGGDPLVHAAFHPAMVGGRENAHRLVGLLRRSPDAFLQFIPPGMQAGGTVMQGEPLPKAPALADTFTRMVKDGGIEAVIEALDALHAERAERCKAFSFGA
ncbi:MAG: hypothetical protein U0414_00960 [Polyangiaceae bacterium]